MVERMSNTIILYPVADRTTATQIPIIERHVEKGSKIYSDGFASYFHLNELGYEHFTVLHKYAFKKTYRHTVSGNIEYVHTNRIEGAWKHAKDYFRKMSGTNANQWEGHMAEIMWRSHVKGDVYTAFYNLVRSVYSLKKAPIYTYTTPLFDSWQGFSGKEMVEPAYTDMESAESETTTQSEPESQEVVVITSEEEVPSAIDILEPVPGPSTCYPTASQRRSDKRELISDLLQSSDSDDFNKTLTPIKKTDNVRCPKGYIQTKVETIRPKRKCSNIYTKDNYVCLFSSDDDFVESVPKKLSKKK